MPLGRALRTGTGSAQSRPSVRTVPRRRKETMTAARVRTQKSDSKESYCRWGIAQLAGEFSLKINKYILNYVTNMCSV